MSDKPQGPGWWLASDGSWHPPELHPSNDDSAVAASPDEAPVATVEMPPLGPVTPRAVPSLPDPPKRPTWSGETDRRPESGPMFPDLFEQAVAGTPLANAVTVHYADGEHRESLDSAPSSGMPGGTGHLTPSDGRQPAEVGAFTGASAKKRRWRL